jgi:hypothetical protein
MEMDSKRFPKSCGWGYALFNYDAASDKFTADPSPADCGNSCHTAVKAKDYIRMPVANEGPAMAPPTMTMSYPVGAKGISQNRRSACHANHCTVDSSSDHQQNLTTGALFGHSLSLGRVVEWKLPAYGDAQFAVSDRFSHELEHFRIRC